MSTGLLVGGYILFILLVGAWWWIGYPLRCSSVRSSSESTMASAFGKRSSALSVS